jgi:hypothetical protein
MMHSTMSNLYDLFLHWSSKFIDLNISHRPHVKGCSNLMWMLICNVHKTQNLAKNHSVLIHRQLILFRDYLRAFSSYRPAKNSGMSAEHSWKLLYIYFAILVNLKILLSMTDTLCWIIRTYILHRTRYSCQVCFHFVFRSGFRKD